MNWRLARLANGEVELDDWSDADREEDLAAGFSLLRALAPEWQLQEIRPGMWLQSKGGEHHGGSSV